LQALGRFSGVFDEALHFVRIFAAGTLLDAAGYIDAIRTHNAHRLGYVLWSQATRKDKRYLKLKVMKQEPRNSFPGPSMFPWHIGIYKNRRGKLASVSATPFQIAFDSQ